MPVQVVFDVREPGSHLVTMEQTFPASETKDRTFRMAAWVPGSYKIRDFGRHVQDVEAEIAGKAAKVEQAGKDAWRIRRTAGKRVKLTFRVYCRELTVDTSHMTADHAHLFPATLVLYDSASRELEHTVTVRKPRGWKLWTGLETAAFDGRLEVARDYDHLIDCPIEVGPPADYHEERFDLRGRKHRLVWWMPPKGMDAERLCKDVRAICDETARLFDGLPYEHYTFLSHVAQGHGGGLEHRNSTVLGVDPIDVLADDKIQERFYPLVAHEFFHTWNVKRILPAEFVPYDLQTEAYTGLLWLFEGFTTYYELPLLARAGVVDDKRWGKLTAHLLKFYEMARGRHHRSVADCSRLTWTLLYQPFEHNINRNVSYYTKGLFVGLCLDAELRKRGVSDGLDVVMRQLWKEFGGAPDDQAAHGLEEDGFADLVERATGEDVRALLRNWTEGTTRLPIDESLRYLGWTVEREPSDKDKPRGLNVIFKEGTQTIAAIPEESAAAQVLQPADELLAVGGYKWRSDQAADWFNHEGAGDTVQVALFREGRLRTFDVPLGDMPEDKITVKHLEGDAAATRRRNTWLKRSRN